MSRRVRKEWLDRVASIPDLAASDGDALYDAVASDPEIRPWLPEARVSVDPRSGTRTVYSPARAGRPHDHPPPPPPEPEDCVVCAGRTTQVLDRAPLSGGHETFVNLNLFPVVAPRGVGPFAEEPGAGPASGVHLLQWVSTDHDADLHNLAPADLAVVVERMGVVEDRLYRAERAGMPGTGPDRRGHVGIVKNVGRLVGGSLVHGHQQILQTNVRPLALARDAEFREREGVSFAGWILAENPEELTVTDYDGRVRTLVPSFMARPFDLLIVVRDPAVEDVRDLSPAGRLALARALRDATEAIVSLMPEHGREVAYNLVFHNGIAGGLYVEVLPWMQERGGYEALGLGLCEGTPEAAAERVRRFLRERGPVG